MAKKRVPFVMREDPFVVTPKPVRPAPNVTWKHQWSSEQVEGALSQSDFGKLPTESIELIEVVRLRRVAIELGMEKIILKNQKKGFGFIALLLENMNKLSLSFSLSKKTFQ